MSMLGRLIIGLSADTVEFEGDMGRASRIAEREMERMMARASAAGELIGRAIGSAANHFIRMADETIRLGDELSKFSQKSNFSVERLSELEYGAKLADVSMGQLKAALTLFNVELSEAGKESSKAGQLFKALGVDITQGPQVAFDQFVESVNKLPDTETKVAVMRQAFGRAGAEMIPLLKNLQETTEKARALGMVMSTENANAAERAKDAMTELNRAMQPIILAMTPTITGFATLAENLNKARQMGEGLKGVFIELTSVLVAGLGALTPWNDAFAKWWFDRADQFRSSPEGGAPAAGAGAAGGGEPNVLAAACAVNGGKWVNGQCVYKTPPKGRKGRDDSGFLGRQLTEGMEEEAKVMAEAAQATDDYTRKMREREYEESRAEGLGIDTLNKTTEMLRQEIALRLQSIDAESEAADQRARAYAGFDESGRAVVENLKEQKSLAKDLGLTFTSAFEDAVIAGKKFSDVLRSLAQDLARIMLRKTITEPLGNAASGFFSNLVKGGIGSLFGGGSGGVAGGDAIAAELVGYYDKGTDYVPRTGLAMVHQGEAIIPASQNRGGGTNVNVNLTVNSLDPRGATAGIMANMPAIARVLRQAASDQGKPIPF